jgi:hypothetical protein
MENMEQKMKILHNRVLVEALYVIVDKRKVLGSVGGSE